MGKLVHFLANGTVREIKLDRERITIGRRPDNDVCLPQPPVSGAHAAVVTVLADSFLEDLASTNGTLVNGKAIKKHFLHDRDEIDIGREILVYVADDAATVEAPPQARDRLRDSGGAAGANAAAPSGAGAADASPRGKRRSDGQAGPARVADGVARPAAAAVENTPGAPTPAEPAPPMGADDAAPPEPAPENVPAIRVLTGTRAGRVLPLAKAETLVGRAGVQVAALRRTGEEVRIVGVEGAHPPSVNGIPLASDGQALAVGDVVEIAGARLELVAPADSAA